MANFLIKLHFNNPHGAIGTGNAWVDDQLQFFLVNDSGKREYKR